MWSMWTQLEFGEKGALLFSLALIAGIIIWFCAGLPI